MERQIPAGAGAPCCLLQPQRDNSPVPGSRASAGLAPEPPWPPQEGSSHLLRGEEGNGRSGPMLEDEAVVCSAEEKRAGGQ